MLRSSVYLTPREEKPPTSANCGIKDYVHQSESISQYGYSIRRLVTLAYPEMPRDARDVFAIDHFIHGLISNDMKKHVHFNHPKTLDEAITLAVEYEACESSIEMPKQTTVRV